MSNKNTAISSKEPIHEWFGLSYSNYLVLQRTVLQSISTELQERFVKCLEDITEELGDPSDANGGYDDYLVKLRNDDGQFIHDDLADYERGRRRVNFKK